MTNKCIIISQIITLSYMFRHYRVVLREPLINTLLSYTSISNAAVGNTICISVETCRSVIICEIIVHLLVIVQNNKRFTVHVLK